MKQTFKIDEELLKKVIDITDVDYTGELELEDIKNIIKDLVCEYNVLKEKLEDKEEHCKEWHVEKQVDWYDYYGVGRDDFV